MTMNLLKFTTNISKPIGLQNLKTELENIGIYAFTIDFIYQNILTVKAENTSIEQITQAIQKAGFHSQFFA